jgi:hypothetical protein
MKLTFIYQSVKDLPAALASYGDELGLDVVAFTKQHPDVRWVGEVIDLPDGRSASFADPSGNIVHIFDQQAQQAADVDQA